jgi:hypothetical protein
MFDKKKLAAMAGSVTALVSSTALAQEGAAGANQFNVQAAAALGAGLASLAALGAATGPGRAAGSALEASAETGAAPPFRRR